MRLRWILIGLSLNKTRPIRRAKGMEALRRPSVFGVPKESVSISLLPNTEYAVPFLAPQPISASHQYWAMQWYASFYYEASDLLNSAFLYVVHEDEQPVRGCCTIRVYTDVNGQPAESCFFEIAHKDFEWTRIAGQNVSKQLLGYTELEKVDKSVNLVRQVREVHIFNTSYSNSARALNRIAIIGLAFAGNPSNQTLRFSVSKAPAVAPHCNE